jgi:hypothetical protein
MGFRVTDLRGDMDGEPTARPAGNEASNVRSKLDAFTVDERRVELSRQGETSAPESEPFQPLLLKSPGEVMHEQFKRRTASSFSSVRATRSRPPTRGGRRSTSGSAARGHFAFQDAGCAPDANRRVTDTIATVCEHPVERGLVDYDALEERQWLPGSEAVADLAAVGGQLGVR